MFQAVAYWSQSSPRAMRGAKADRLLWFRAHSGQIAFLDSRCARATGVDALAANCKEALATPHRSAPAARRQSWVVSDDACGACDQRVEPPRRADQVIQRPLFSPASGGKADIAAGPSRATFGC